MGARVSVCIPAFNAELTIGHSIQSVLDQKGCDFNIIVVDNASVDRTCEVVESFSDPRVRLFRNDSNIGYPANVNRCLSLVDGDFFCILCSDDYYIHEHVLSDWLAVLGANPACVAAHSAFTHPLGMNAEIVGRAYSILPEGVCIPEQVIDAFLSGRGFFGWGWCVRSSLLQDGRLMFNESLTMAPDTLFWLDVALRGNVIEMPYGKPAYAFVIHQGSLGSKLFQRFRTLVYGELIQFERCFREKLMSSRFSASLGKFVFGRYSCNESICILKNNYLSGNLSWIVFLQETFFLLKNHPFACCNSRFFKNLIVLFLPKKMSVFLRGFSSVRGMFSKKSA